MRTISSGVILLTVCLLSIPKAQGGDPSKRPPFLLSIAMPKHHNQRRISNQQEIPIVLVNISKEKQRFWQRWCSWGWGNLSLEFEIGDKSIPIHRRPGVWSKNYPDHGELDPTESMIFPIKLGNGTWELKPLLPHVPKNGKPLKVRMRAHYQVSRDGDSRRLKVWDGKISSAWQSYDLHWK